MSQRFVLSMVVWLMIALASLGADQKPRGRKPKTDDDARYWLRNMARHGYSEEEKAAALGVDSYELKETYQRLKLNFSDALDPPKSGIQILPYPGGRHPRIGFLEGAINPQRETKVSAFTPWDKQSYVVIDIPEALWSNLGLTYLAHTHIDTVWTRAKIELEPLEWERHKDGSLSLERKLPNGIVYRAEVEAKANAVAMSLTLTNGTKEKLSDLRVQNCVMLKGAKGFEQQTNENKRFASPFAYVSSADGKRHIITAWERCQRAWGNAPCPCLHSDPQFPHLAPGESAQTKGWLWFYEGDELQKELARVKQHMES